MNKEHKTTMCFISSCWKSKRYFSCKELVLLQIYAHYTMWSFLVRNTHSFLIRMTIVHIISYRGKKWNRYRPLIFDSEIVVNDHISSLNKCCCMMVDEINDFHYLTLKYLGKPSGHYSLDPPLLGQLQDLQFRWYSVLSYLT